VRSQAASGWTVLPTRYDDGGFTGANTDRPALARLFEDIERKKVDIVVVAKVDRLSRSLLDFTRLMETFERHEVGFVSVTQSFDTSTSMGRLVLNILMSFAEFEREMISERTRDKIRSSTNGVVHRSGDAGESLSGALEKCVKSQCERPAGSVPLESR
jgi:site-specific DNA recombinase